MEATMAMITTTATILNMGETKPINIKTRYQVLNTRGSQGEEEGRGARSPQQKEAEDMSLRKEV